MDSTSYLAQALDYIEEHLQDSLSVDLLAGQATLSPFYFHRLFSKVVGKPVMDYVRARRLTQAARTIRESSLPLHEIARRVGYANYETFSRDFKTIFSRSASGFRKDASYAVTYTPKFDLALMQSLLPPGVVHVAQGMTLEVSVVALQQQRHVVGLSKLAGITRGKDDPGMLWGLFSPEVVAGIPDQAIPPVDYGIGISNHCGHGFTYIAARQVTTLAHAPQGYTSHTIPAGVYAVCTFEAKSFDRLTNEALYTAGNYMLHTWLPSMADKYVYQNDMTIEEYDADSYRAEAPRMRYYFPIIVK